MRRATIALSAAAAIAVGGGVVWAVQPSYDDIVEDCIAAVKARPEGDKSKPAACEDVKEADYTTIVMHQVLQDDGWFNKDGGVNKEKLIDPDGE